MKSIFTLVALQAVSCGNAQAAEKSPNIVLLMGDDHGWEETGYNGHPHVKTPVLDEIAATGLRFDQFYSAHPSCSPTRASFLTGRHPNRMGTFAPGWSMRPQEITIAHILNQAGYRCGHFGKWHVGPVKAGSPTNPGAMGFHEWVSHDNFFELNPSLSRNGEAPKVFPGRKLRGAHRRSHSLHRRPQNRRTSRFSPSSGSARRTSHTAGCRRISPSTTICRLSTRKQVRLTSNETGAPTTRPQGEVLRERYAEITAMDRAIGKLRKHLAAEDLRENTLLFYCGDNGTSADSALGVPHRGVKGQVYEGGILVPGLIEWPVRIPQPRTTRVRASTSDLLPTVCALVGQPLPERPLDGIDLTAVLDGNLDERPSPLCFWSYNTRRLERSDPQPWIDPELQQGTTPLVKLMNGKATRDFKNYRQPPITEDDYLGPRAIIDGRFKLVLHEQPNGAQTRAIRSRSGPGRKGQCFQKAARRCRATANPAPGLAAFRSEQPVRQGLPSMTRPPRDSSSYLSPADARRLALTRQGGLASRSYQGTDVPRSPGGSAHSFTRSLANSSDSPARPLTRSALSPCRFPVR